MITVNLLDYKEELRKVAMQKIIINAIGSVLFLIFLIVTYWCFQKIEINYRANELKQLEGQVRELTAQTTKIQSMKLQAKRTKKIIKKILFQVIVLRTGNKISQGDSSEKLIKLKNILITSLTRNSKLKKKWMRG